jgi:competence protein ComEC
MMMQWLKTAAAVSIVAWLVATPIGLYHFGMISPLGALLSIVAVPISAVLLALGYAKTVLSLVLPSAAMLLGLPLSIGADMLLAIVNAADGLPISMLKLPYPTALWTLTALAWVCWWCLAMRRDGWRRAAMAASATALALWITWPMITPSSGANIRIDMLAVGDGSCYLVRSGGHTVVFDAGSSTNLDAGRRTIIPAMRRLGVRSIDAIAVSHPDIDHYSAVIELSEEFDVGQVFVTPQFLEAAQRDAASSAAHLIDALTKRRVMVTETTAGHERSFGLMRWQWLHPPANEPFQRDNDGSMVVLVNAADRSLLLCGDIQQQAIGTMKSRGGEIRAEVMELPHHGSFNEDAALFVKAVSPRVVMQSTGWTRWKRDQWEPHLAGIDRLVTARDGACWIEMDADGAIRTGRFHGD